MKRISLALLFQEAKIRELTQIIKRVNSGDEMS